MGEKIKIMDWFSSWTGWSCAAHWARGGVVFVKLGMLAVFFSCSLLLGCSGEASCHAKGCMASVNFSYATPLEGSLYEVQLQPGGGTFECELTEEKKVQCDPAPTIWGEDWFTPEGKLSSISWSGAPEGELHVAVKVDGKLVTDQRFNYEKSKEKEECPMSCPEATRFELDVLTQ